MELAVTPPARRYRSRVRADAAAATRAAVVAALAEQLGRAGHRAGATALDLPAAAAAAGVSLRTVYHHLPDPTERLRAVAEWAEVRLGPVGRIASVDDLAAHVRRVGDRVARRPVAARALVAAGTVDEARTRRLRARQLEIAALLTGIGAPAGPTTRATAVVSLLASVESAVALTEVHGLAPTEAAGAAAQAVEAVVADLRARRRLDG